MVAFLQNWPGNMPVEKGGFFLYNREVDFQNLLAFFPNYGPQGLNTSLVFYDGSRKDIEVSVKSLTRRACAAFALDKKALSNAARFVTGRPHLVPLPLRVDCTFAPIKNLNPLVKGDSSYGYYLLQGIMRVEKMEQGSLLVMRSGVELAVTQSRNVVLGHIARALLFERMFWSKRLGKDY
jgi:hypothetical protein